MSLFLVCVLRSAPWPQTQTSRRPRAKEAQAAAEQVRQQSLSVFVSQYYLDACPVQVKPVIMLLLFSLHRYLTRWSIDSVKPIYKRGLKWCKKRISVGHPALKNNVRYGVKPLYLKHWRSESLTNWSNNWRRVGGPIIQGCRGVSCLSTICAVYLDFYHAAVGKA